MKKWKIALVVFLVLGIGTVGYMSIQEPVVTTQETVDYTDPFTIGLLLNPEIYVGREVTLALDKQRFFPDVNVWKQTHKYVTETENETVIKTDIHYEEGVFVIDKFGKNIIIMNMGPTVNITGAKAVKITGTLMMKVWRIQYEIEAKKIEVIYKESEPASMPTHTNTSKPSITPPPPSTSTSTDESTKISQLINDLGNSARQDDTIDALVAIGTPAIEHLIDALNDERWRVREGVAKALGRMGEKRAVEPLTRTLNDKNTRVQKAALEALEKLGWKPRRLPTWIMKNKLNWGKGELTIENRLDLDAVAVLSGSDKPKEALVVVYIRSNDVYTIRDIPDGVYILYYTLGKDWDDESRKFTLEQAKRRFEEKLEFETAGRMYTTYTAILHQVPGGTARTEEVSEGEFPEL